MYRKNTVQKNKIYINISLVTNISSLLWIVLVCSKHIFDWVNHSIGQHHPTLIFFSFYINAFYIQTAIFRKKAGKNKQKNQLQKEVDF